MKWDLSENFKLIDESIDPHDSDNRLDLPAKVFSPLGGGRNYGVFFLPQVNEKGIVVFMKGNNKSPVWLGSFFETTWDDADYKSLYVNVPSDDMTKEGTDSDGGLNGEPNMEAEDPFGTNIIIRTKRTKSDNAENLNWEKIQTSNIISIGEEGIKIKHFNKDDGYNGTTPEKYKNIELTTEEIKIETINAANSKNTIINIKEDSFDIVVTGDINITASDSGKVNIIGDPEIILNADNDTAVKYSDLISIIEEFEGHVHISQGPAGPTTIASKGPAGVPDIGSIIGGYKANMESKNIKVE